MKNIWLLSGLGAGVSYGVHNLLLGKISEDKGIMAPLYACFGIMLAFTIRSAIFSFNKKEQQHTPWLVQLPHVIGGILADVMVAQTFYYAAHDGINQGIITSIFSMCSINTALLFWYMYEEKP